MRINPYNNVKYQWAVYVVFFIFLACIPTIVGDDVFLLNQLSTYGVYGILALSLSLCWGFGGILNLGQGIAFGLGSYGMAMTMQLQSQDILEDRIPPFMLNNAVETLPAIWEPFWNAGAGISLALIVPTLFCPKDPDRRQPQRSLFLVRCYMHCLLTGKSYYNREKPCYNGKSYYVR